MAQHSLIVLPVVLEQLEVSVIERSGQFYRIIVVHLPMAVELILGPVSLICQLSAFVVEPAKPVHFVILPLPLIVPSILVVKLPSAIAHIIAFEALIPTACLILLHNVFFLVGFF